MTANVVIRRARSSDAEAIARLIAVFAAEALMLRRTPEMVELAIDDYVVGVDASGEIVACGALKEYSPSVAEIAAIAVSRDVHGCGVGKAIVNAVEMLALKRGIYDVFALTLQPAFFAAIGYQRVDRAGTRRRSAAIVSHARGGLPATRSASPRTSGWKPSRHRQREVPEKIVVRV